MSSSDEKIEIRIDNDGEAHVVGDDETSEGYPIEVITRHPGDPGFVSPSMDGTVIGEGNDCVLKIVVTLNSTNDILNIRRYLNCTEEDPIVGAPSSEDIDDAFDSIKSLF